MILYPDDTLLIAQLLKEMIVARNTLIFLLQNLGFLINIKQSVFERCHTIEFLRVIVDSKDMTISLKKQKFLAIIEECHLFLTKTSLCERDLSTN